MKVKSLLLTVLLLITSISSCQESPAVDPNLKAELQNYIKEHYQTPEDYILSKFKGHDIIFIGEQHRIRHDPILIQTLIPLLCQNGIYYLGTEFARREDQHLIDSLLNGPSYDEALARLITFQQHVHWGFQEYVDIFKAAWQVNRRLPSDARRFKILGLNDSPDWSFVQSQEDREKDEIKKKIWRGGGEHLWAQVLLDSVVAKGEKALVYSGAHHSFTEYLQPVYFDGKFHRFEDRRMGRFVYDKIGKRAITIYLHAPWFSQDGYDKLTLAADGIIDGAMEELPKEFQRAGFDTKGTAFGRLTGDKSIYKHGYDKFTLEIFCDGYIYQKPLSAYQGVTPIEDFINEANLEHARQQSPSPSFRKASVEEFYQDLVQAANFPERFPRR